MVDIVEQFNSVFMRLDALQQEKMMTQHKLSGATTVYQTKNGKGGGLIEFEREDMSDAERLADLRRRVELIDAEFKSLVKRYEELRATLMN